MSRRRGSTASFTLSRTGQTTDALTVSVADPEDGDMLAEPQPTTTSFAAGSATATMDVATVGDDSDESGGRVVVALETGENHRLGTNDEVRGEQKAVAVPDLTLNALTFSDATLSPAFGTRRVVFSCGVEPIARRPSCRKENRPQPAAADRGRAARLRRTIASRSRVRFRPRTALDNRRHRASQWGVKCGVGAPCQLSTLLTRITYRE